MKALIIDDEPMPAKHLQEMIRQYCFEVKSTTILHSPAQAIEEVESTAYDIIFLDVEMPEMSGLEFLKKVNISAETSVIFTTAYSNYAVDAFQVNAVHYIMKPIEENELIKAVRKVRQKQLKEPKTESNTLTVYDGEEYLIVKKENIIRLEADGSYTKFVLEGKSILVSKRMGTFESKLNSKQFIRCHNSHIVNLDKIKKLGKNKSTYLILTNEEVVPIATSKKAEIESILGL